VVTSSVSDGIVSAIRDSGQEELVQITAPVSQGSSGSPVLDLNGDVIGVATMMLEGGQNLNFAVSSRHIQSLWPGKFASTTSSLTGPKPRLGSRWRMLNNDETRYDKQSLSKVGDIVSVWIRYSEENGTYLQVLNELNCSTRKIRSTQSVVYDREGNVQKSSTTVGDWAAIIPDSNGESYFEVFCTGYADRESEIELEDLFEAADKFEKDNNVVAAVATYWDVLRFYAGQKGATNFMIIYSVLSKSSLERIYEKANDFIGSEKLYLFGIAGGDSSDYVPLARLYKKQRMAAKFQSTLFAGIKALEHTVAAKNAASFDYSGLAELYTLQNQDEKAISTLLRGLQRFPTEVDLAISVGAIYNRLKKWRACIDVGEKLLPYAKGSYRKDLLVLLKTAYSASGDLKSAAKTDRELQTL
jgi:tetratricopeptide (TPR) repeat protein